MLVTRQISFVAIQQTESPRPQFIYTFILSTFSMVGILLKQNGKNGSQLAGWEVGAMGTNSYKQWGQKNGNRAQGGQPVLCPDSASGQNPPSGPRVDTRPRGQHVRSVGHETLSACSVWGGNMSQPSQHWRPGEARQETDDAGPRLDSYRRGGATHGI